MSETATSANHIQSGTAEGLLEFLDYVIVKGYGTSAAVSPLKSAARQIFVTVEGNEEFGDVNVRELDVDGYLDRFETKARGDLKAESSQAYRRRFGRAHEAYVTFLGTGRPPTFRTSRKASRSSPEPRRAMESSVTKTPVAPTPSNAGPMIDYPFPLRSGQVATLRLPVQFEKADAERVAAFVRTLVFEPMLELSVGDARDASDAK